MDISLFCCYLTYMKDTKQDYFWSLQTWLEVWILSSEINFGILDLVFECPFSPQYMMSDASIIRNWLRNKRGKWQTGVKHPIEHVSTIGHGLVWIFTAYDGLFLFLFLFTACFVFAFPCLLVHGWVYDSWRALSGDNEFVTTMVTKFQSSNIESNGLDE